MTSLDYYTPSISVVCATYNRPKSLMHLLDVLNDQRCVHLGASVDVCVVDDGSRESLHGKFPQYRFRFEYIYRERHPDNTSRVYSSRNLAASRTKGEYILQMDDDLEVHPYCLNMLQSMAGMSDRGHWVWTARLSDTIDIDLSGYDNFTHGKDGYWRDGKVQWMETHWRSSSSAGMFMPRYTWDALGGYDEQFDGCMGAADQELALRVQKLPGRVWLAPYFIHLDDRETGSWRMAMIDKRKPGRERNEDILSRKHPDADEWTNV